MNTYTVLLDANILYPAPMRDVFMQLALTNLFRVRWTKDIHQEWINALVRNQPDRKRSDLERTRDLMNQSIRDCLIEGYEFFIPDLELPDTDDRHVLAAAIVGRCDLIITQNLKDFPADILAHYGLEAQHPDAFLLYHLKFASDIFCLAIHKIRSRLKNPPFTVNEYLQTLQRQGLVATVQELESFTNMI